MKKNLSYLVITLCFLSCNGLEETFEQQPKSFELAEIRWKRVENDNSELVQITLPEKTYSNHSNTLMEVEIDPLSETRGSSTFNFVDSIGFHKLNLEPTHITPPTNPDLLSESYSYISGGKEVLLATEPQELPFSIHFSDSYTVPAHAELIYTATLYLREVKSGFSTKFKEKESGVFLELEGLWQGTVYERLETSIIVNNLE
ncbi:hypothetical protein [Pleomorphovibrio marinus]|uniref:hypothetical protein n=1 Tax=Pleomorphovibrio marinus TaxID=2164132 RepID=UPI000E0C4AF6|nr:hypothetical protein [Pleomorphovibrio marinus]